MKQFAVAVMLCLAVCSGGCFAQESVSMTSDQVEMRMVLIAEEFLCLICQNEPLADSSAELAKDLRREISEQIKAGKSDREVVDFMVSRYGDFVLYRPKFKATPLLLWIGAALLLAAGIGALVRHLRRRGKQLAEMN